jgi:hypothetical protein
MRPRAALTQTATRAAAAVALAVMAAGCAPPDLPPAQLPADTPYPRLVPVEPLLAEAARPPVPDPEAARQAQEGRAAALRARAAALRGAGPG